VKGLASREICVRWAACEMGASFAALRRRGATGAPPRMEPALVNTRVNASSTVCELALLRLTRRAGEGNT